MRTKETKQLKEIAEYIRKAFLKVYGTGLPYQLLEKILENMVEEFRIKYVSEIAIDEEIVPTVSSIIKKIPSSNI
jgi:hypothetical protein